MLEISTQQEYADTLTKDNQAANVRYLVPLNNKWIPGTHNIAYSKKDAFETFKQFRLDKVYIQLSDFKFKNIYNSKKSCQVEDEKVVTFQYKWDNDKNNITTQAHPMLGNENKLPRTVRIQSEKLGATWKYKFTPKYDSQGGWMTLMNKQGFGSYDELLNSYNNKPRVGKLNSGFMDFLDAVGCQSYVDEAVNPDERANPTTYKNWLLPRLMFAKRREFKKDFWNNATTIENVTEITTCNMKTKTYWSFRQPRIDPIDTP